MPRKVARHLVFWLAFSVHVLFFRFYVYDLKYLTYGSTYLTRLEDLLLFLPVSVFYAYFSIYLLLPRLVLKGKYVQLAVVIFLLSILLVAFSYFLSILFNIKLAWDMPAIRANIVRQIDFTFNNGIVYPLTVSGFAIGIKMGKNFYLQQKENTELAIQKIHSDVQLLKSQVHPRFLFHSLKNIHDDMLAGARESPGMLIKLSELLSYILYESDQLVPLNKEMLLLLNYIDLEKISWGEQLTVKMNIGVMTGPGQIEPLLLLPLAEYVFGNIDKRKNEKVSIDVDIGMQGGTLYFTVAASGVLESQFCSMENDVHLVQVQKRMQSQYPGKHSFSVSTQENAVSISLSLEIQNDSVFHQNF